jgi:hypothetical protein
MAKGGTSEVLVIVLHMVGKMSMGLDLEILLKSPNVARELGSFIIYTFPPPPLLFFFLFFFIFFVSSLFSLFFLYYLLPLNSRLH